MGERNTTHSIGQPLGLAARSAKSASAFDRWLGRAGLDVLGPIPARVFLWDGSPANAAAERGDAASVATVRVHDRATLYRLLLDPDVEFGDAYSDGRISVEGNLVSLLEAVFARSKAVGLVERGRHLVARLRPSSHSLLASRRNIHHHYDLDTRFFKLWLDPTMAYSCAYFSRSDLTLAEAQRAKLDYVCRKVGLRPGERVVEAGSGWGALAVHAAKHYDVHVRSFNISHEQVEYSRALARREGVSDRVEFIEDDYRSIRGSCDAFLSVGMLEHVGVKQYGELSSVIDRCLSREGRGLIHTMGRNQPVAMNRWIATRVFPGGHAPTLGELSRVLEPSNLSVLDVENLRLHYVPTIEHWLEAFERSKERVGRMFDERFVRMWRLYLASAAASFSSGSLQLFQVVFARGASNSIPWTRARLYAND